MKASGNKIGDFRDLKMKLSKILDELGSLKQSLDMQTMFESIKTTTNLDSDSLI